MGIKPDAPPVRTVAKFFAALFVLSLLPAMPDRVAAGEVPVPWKKVSFVTGDGLTIVGDFMAAKPGKPTAVLLHGLGSNRGEWYTFCRKLAGKGYGFFSYDARGHGESTKSMGGDLSYKYFLITGPGSEWANMLKDLGDVMNYLAKTHGIPKTKIGLVGASLGANVALNYAALQKHAPFLVLLSPGLNYAGFTAETPMRMVGDIPVLIAASEDDRFAFRSSQFLSSIDQSSGIIAQMDASGQPARKNVSFWPLKGKGHGVQMFAGGVDNKIISWFGKNTK